MSIAAHLVNGIHVQMRTAAPEHEPLPKGLNKPQIEKSTLKFGKKEATLAATTADRRSVAGVKRLSSVTRPDGSQNSQDAVPAESRRSVRQSITSHHPAGFGQPPSVSGSRSSVSFTATGVGMQHSTASLHRPPDHPEEQAQQLTDAPPPGLGLDPEVERDLAMALTPAEATELHQLGSRYKMALAMVALKDLERTLDSEGFSKSFIETQEREEKTGLEKAKREYVEHLLRCGFEKSSEMYQKLMSSAESSCTPIPENSKRSEREFTARELGLRQPAVGASRPASFAGTGGDRLKGLFTWDQPELPPEMVIPDRPMHPLPEPPQLPPKPEESTPLEDMTMQESVQTDIDDFDGQPEPPEEAKRVSVLPPIPPRQKPPRVHDARPTTHHIPTRLSSRTVTPQVFAPRLMDQMKIEGQYGVPQWQTRPVRKRLPSSSHFGLLNPQFASTYYQQVLDGVGGDDEAKRAVEEGVPTPLAPHNQVQLEEKLHKIAKARREESGGLMYAGFDGRTITARTVKELQDKRILLEEPVAVRKMGAVRQGFTGLPSIGNAEVGVRRDFKLVGHQAFTAPHFKVLRKYQNL